VRLLTETAPIPRLGTLVRNLGVGTILPGELEIEVVQWVNELRDEGIPISTRMLTDKARQVASEASIDNFHASDKWVLGFKCRHQFSLRVPTRQSQISPADIAAVAAAFASTVNTTMRDLGITRVFNADQTGIAFRSNYLWFTHIFDLRVGSIW